jgi:ABC-type polar amino acid transport system ATPase subunit
VLLLDEPTSALDPKSSALVSQALEQASWNHLEPSGTIQKQIFFMLKKSRILKSAIATKKNATRNTVSTAIFNS